MKKLAATSIIVGLLTSSFAQAIPYKGPGKPQSSAANKALWNTYCIDTADENAPIRPKYTQTTVRDAAEILNEVSPISFYFYSGPLKSYGLKSKSQETPEGAPRGTKNTTHNFLTILCGEFRDRASMIKAKLNWVLNLHKLPTTKQKKIDYKKPVWGQVSAHSYQPYLDFSFALYSKRREQIGYISLTSTLTLEKPVPAQTVCETKYIFGEYIAKEEPFSDLQTYDDGYKKFAKVNCTAEDQKYFYDFRGDSNFKPNTPESNGMIWYSNSLTTKCQNTKTAKTPIKVVTDQNCSDYFESPFLSRWNAARSGLATWLFHAPKHADSFSVIEEPVTILPKIDSFDSPFSFRIGTDEKELKDFIPAWNRAKATNLTEPDMGFSKLVGLGTTKVNYTLAYERMRNFVDRHADWYSSGYDDGLGTVREEAYSPFVASSYEMTASDEFTWPGATVDSPTDGRKHWMFVFKVKVSNWYTSLNLQKGDEINFDEMWFDETTIGTTEFAKTERAWDRLGTVLEEELDSILYLHNIDTDGQVVSK